MSKAFLSHSTFDADTVGEVFAKLGAAKAIYDKVTFARNCDLPAQIEQGLHDAEVYVLFLSKAAITSGWVNSEIDVAHELKSKWKIKHFLIFQMDATPWSELPGWMSKFVVSCPPSPNQVALKILDVLRFVNGEEKICYGREEDAKKLTFDILERDTPPSFIYVSGPVGIGRKTFLTSLYKSLYKEIAEHKISITVEPFDDINSIYRKLLAYSANWRARDLFDATRAYEALGDTEKIVELSNQLVKISVNFRQVIVFDIGISALDDHGRPLSWFSKLMEVLPSADYPYIWFVSQRFLSDHNNEKGIFFAVPALSEHNSTYLFKLLIHENKINFPDKKEKAYIENSIVGHPGLITQVVNYLRINPNYKPNKTYNQVVKIIANQIEGLLKDFINGDIEKEKAVAFFSESHILSYEEIVKVGEIWPAFEDAVEDLMEAGFLFRVNGDYQLVTYLQRFSHTLSEEHYKSLADARRVLLNSFDSLSADTFIPVQLLDARIVGLLNSGATPDGFLTNLIMPAQQLKAAKRKYDERDYKVSLKLALEAYEQSGKLSETGTLEAWRLIGLSAIRLKDDINFAFFEAQKDKISQSGKRNAIFQFAQGFKCRHAGNIREAADWFEQIELQGLSDAHVLRELAYINAFEGNYEKALDRVRRALKLTPMNAYTLDIKAFSLTEKYRQQKSPELLDEVEECLSELKTASSDSALRFHLVRKCVLDILINDDQESLNRVYSGRQQLPIHAKISLLRLLSIKGKTVQFNQLRTEIEKIVHDTNNRLANIEFERVQIEHYAMGGSKESITTAREKLRRFQMKLTQTCVTELDSLIKFGEAKLHN